MFLEYNQDQNFLLPPSIIEFLGDNHEAVMLNEIIERLDLTKLYATYKNENVWTLAYHPKMLLKVIFYAYMTWTFSSRKIGKKLRDSLAFMYLAGNNTPDFRTVNRFRKERLIIVEDIFLQIVNTAKKLWLLKFGTVFLDGTKIYADASKSKNYTIEWIDETMRKLLRKAEEIDALEDSNLWDNEDDLPEELKNKETRKKRLEEIQKELEKQEEIKKEVQKEIESKKLEGVKLEKVNMTDKDSRMMQMKRKDFANWYNTQILTEDQFIVTTTVSNHAPDQKELAPIIEKFEQQYDGLPKELVADKWYSSTENYENLEQKGIDWYIPTYQDLQVKLEDYTYNKEEDVYTDQTWNVYIFKQNWWKIDWDNKKWRPWKDTDKSQYLSTIYQSKDLINWKKKYLEIRPKRIEHHGKQTEKMKTIRWKELSRARKFTVEPIFGNIKRNFGFETFSLRGLIWVNIERNIVCIAHNLKKLMNLQSI